MEAMLAIIANLRPGECVRRLRCRGCGATFSADACGYRAWPPADEIRCGCGCGCDVVVERKGFALVMEDGSVRDVAVASEFAEAMQDLGDYEGRGLVSEDMLEYMWEKHRQRMKNASGSV